MDGDVPGDEVEETEKIIENGEVGIDEFNRAANYLKFISGSLNSEQLLYFYGRFKQVNEGPCKQPKPGFFDFQGKQKWEAWNTLESKSQEDAMKEYVKMLTTLYPDWSNENKCEKVGFGVAVSTLYHKEKEIDSKDKTIFDWCIEGNTENVADLLKSDTVHVDSKDKEGMALLHWACDRGSIDMVRLLLSYNADINIKDSDGQTALHYAASCEHEDVVKLLLSQGSINCTIRDVDGSLAIETTSNKLIIQFIKAKS